jgi:maltose alpha-D-glucosyltransferase/alpha-amylase
VGQATGGAIATGLPAVPLKAEQSNSSLVYGDRHLFKLYRKAEEGINPEIELGRFLTAQAQPEPRFAAVLGDLTYRRKGQEPIAVGVLLSYIPDAQDGWRYTLDGLRDYFERMTAARPTDWGSPERCAAVPDNIYAGLGPLVGAMEQLGQRTGEMHHCLAQAPDELAPEPFTSFYQRSLYQSVRNLAGQSLRLLRQRERSLPPEHQALAHRILNAEGQVLAALEPLLSRKIGALRIRCHGDYHLGQVLYTGKDFVILDFEGEPARPLGERRMKRSPLRDVAGMVQSLHYAAQTALQREIEGGIEPETGSRYAEGASQWLGALFWRSYRAAAAGILPTAPIDMQILLEVYLLEKTLYELAYELNNRPAWVGIPLQRLSQGLQTPLSAPLGPFTV